MVGLTTRSTSQATEKLRAERKATSQRQIRGRTRTSMEGALLNRSLTLTLTPTLTLTLTLTLALALALTLTPTQPNPTPTRFLRHAQHYFLAVDPKQPFSVPRAEWQGSGANQRA